MTTSFPFLISKAEDGSESHDDISDEMERCPDKQAEHQHTEKRKRIDRNNKTIKINGE